MNSGNKSVGRMLTLDAMRGAAALAVVTYHALGVAPRTAHSGWESWLPQIAGFVVHFAFAGIYLFFVISGFCIHLYWAKTRAAGVHEPTIDFFAFWKRRVRRLYPATSPRSRSISATSRTKSQYTSTAST